MKRICLLTGASGFFGTAFLERFADQYQIVAVRNRNAIQFATQEQTFVDPLLPSEEVIENQHAAYSVRADISKSEEIDRLVSDVIARFGRIDLLINAAVCRAWSHLLAPSSIDSADMMWNVNVLAPLRLSVGIAR